MWGVVPAFFQNILKRISYFPGKHGLCKKGPQFASFRPSCRKLLVWGPCWWSQCLLLAGLGRLYEVLGTESGSATRQANALPAVLSLQPPEIDSSLTLAPCISYRMLWVSS